MTTFQSIIDRIHVGVNPYTGFDPWPEHHPVLWDDKHPWFAQVIKQLRPQVCVEVGTLMGNSAIHTAKLLKAEGLDAALICVDTFCAEEVLWGMAEHRPMLKITNGRPEFYKQFLSNVIHAGVSDTIVPLPMHSASGARYLANNKIQAELVYIDGCHEQCEAGRDIQIYYDLVLAPGGVLLVDDWAPGNPMFAGLVKDLQDFVTLRGLSFEVNGNKAMIRKAL